MAVEGFSLEIPVTAHTPTTEAHDPAIEVHIPMTEVTRGHVLREENEIAIDET